MPVPSTQSNWGSFKSFPRCWNCLGIKHKRCMGIFILLYYFKGKVFFFSRDNNLNNTQKLVCISHVFLKAVASFLGLSWTVFIFCWETTQNLSCTWNMCPSHVILLVLSFWDYDCGSFLVSNRPNSLLTLFQNPLWKYCEK